LKLIKSISLITIILLLGNVSGFNQLSAQNRIDILNAETLNGEVRDGEQIRQLSGDVKLRSGSRLLYCDEAIQFIERDVVEASGSVFIKTDEEEIWADFVTFNNSSEIAEFRGNVVVHKDTLKIFTRNLRYAFGTKTAYLPEQFLLQDKDANLTSEFGIYFTELDSAAFFGNVQLRDSTKYIEADTLYSNRKAERYELRHNVFLKDSVEQVYLKGNYVFSDSTGYRDIEKNARLARISEEQDTSFILAHRIQLFESDSSYTIVANGDVRIWSKDYAARSQKADYSDSTEIFLLSGKARTWQDQLQLSAPTINITLKNDTLKMLQAWPQPFAAQKDSTSDRIHQMAADSLTAHFKKGKAERVDLDRNAQVLYFLSNESDKNDGAMDVIAQKMSVFFKDGEVNRFKALTNITSNYAEERSGLESIRLVGFIYTPELKPEKPDFPTRSIAPIPVDSLKEVFSPAHYQPRE